MGDTAAAATAAHGVAQADRGDYAGSVASLRTAISLWERTGFCGVMVLRAYHDLGHALACLGETESAILAVDKALAGLDSLYDGDMTDVPLRYDCEAARAGVFSRAGRVTEAIVAYNLSLVTAGLTECAALYRPTGEFEKGLQYLQRAEALVRRLPAKAANLVLSRTQA